MSLFKQDIDPMCSYCSHGKPLSEMEIACPKKGVQKAMDSCKKFRYDPLKRIPPRAQKMDFSDLSPEDFIL